MKAITKRAMQGATAVTTVVVVAGMTGIAAAPASANGHPQFSASGPLTFTSQAVTSTSASQTETITNLADDDTYSIVFAADAVTLAGANAGDFVIAADTCSGVTLGGQATCTVEVRFAPTAVGDRTANLNFAFTATQGVVDPPSPQDIALTGTATPVIAQGPVAGDSPRERRDFHQDLRSPRQAARHLVVAGITWLRRLHEDEDLPHLIRARPPVRGALLPSDTGGTGRFWSAGSCARMPCTTPCPLSR